MGLHISDLLKEWIFESIFLIVNLPGLLISVPISVASIAETCHFFLQFQGHLSHNVLRGYGHAGIQDTFKIPSRMDNLKTQCPVSEVSLENMT